MAGMTTTLLIGAGLKFAGDIIGNKMQSNAAKKASEQQIAAGDKALGIQREALAPYMNTGGAAMTTLGSLFGLPGAPAGGDGAAMPTTPVQGRQRGDAPVIGHAVPRTPAEPHGWGHRLGDAVRTASAERSTASSFAGGRGPQRPAPAMTETSFVRMFDPRSGEQDDVPSQYVEEFRRRGAWVVS